jgi:hypothetical protein
MQKPLSLRPHKLEQNFFAFIHGKSKFARDNNAFHFIVCTFDTRIIAAKMVHIDITY